MEPNLKLLIAIISSFIGGIISLFAIAWRYFLKDIQNNKECIDDLRETHDEDIEQLRETIHDEFDRIRTYVGTTASMGQDDHDLLQRIDERVDTLQVNMDDMRDKIDYIHDKNGGGK